MERPDVLRDAILAHAVVLDLVHLTDPAELERSLAVLVAHHVAVVIVHRRSTLVADI